MITELKSYPILTMETLLIISKRVEDHRTTLEDCLLIDHYVESAGNPGFILQEFSREDVHSFEEFIEDLKRKKVIHSNFMASGILLGAVYFLMRLVADGEKIY